MFSYVFMSSVHLVLSEYDCMWQQGDTAPRNFQFMIVDVSA